MRATVLLMLCLALGACASAAPKASSDLGDPEAWDTMLTAGLAIAPVAGASVVTVSTDAASFFGNELAASLRSALPGTPVTPSGEIFARLEDRGPDAQSRLRSLRRRLIREEELDARELGGIGDDTGARFLLVVFIDEGSVEGIHRTTLDDYVAFSYSMDTHGYPTGELHGQATGFLLDLEAGTKVWSATVEYESLNLAAAGADAERLIADVRIDAVTRLSEALALAGRGDRR